jgi:hypothetical protein
MVGPAEFPILDVIKVNAVADTVVRGVAKGAAQLHGVRIVLIDQQPGELEIAGGSKTNQGGNLKVASGCFAQQQVVGNVKATRLENDAHRAGHIV